MTRSRRRKRNRKGAASTAKRKVKRARQQTQSTSASVHARNLASKWLVRLAFNVNDGVSLSLLRLQTVLSFLDRRQTAGLSVPASFLVGAAGGDTTSVATAEAAWDAAVCEV
eukprot:COSAG06_NODE_898_length_11667_cov_4.407244_15_plen_112_part_00